MKNILTQIQIVRRTARVMRFDKKINLVPYDKMDHLATYCINGPYSQGIHPGKITWAYYNFMFKKFRRELGKNRYQP